MKKQVLPLVNTANFWFKKFMQISSSSTYFNDYMFGWPVASFSTQTNLKRLILKILIDAWDDFFALY